ncbi:MAG TPA: hypothetical protein VFD33_07275 [Bacillota bacterium]|nr:hypothetical protein [Bacillota bacterium]
MDFDKKDISKMSEIADSLKGKSENEAIGELANMVRSGEGGMTPEKFIQLAGMIKPMLNKSQRRKLDKVISELE